MEAVASVRAYQPQLVHGLLQTKDYARAARCAFVTLRTPCGSALAVAPHTWNRFLTCAKAGQFDLRP